MCRHICKSSYYGIHSGVQMSYLSNEKSNEEFMLGILHDPGLVTIQM